MTPTLLRCLVFVILFSALYNNKNDNENNNYFMGQNSKAVPIPTSLAPTVI